MKRRRKSRSQDNNPRPARREYQTCSNYQQQKRVALQNRRMRSNKPLAALTHSIQRPVSGGQNMPHLIGTVAFTWMIRMQMRFVARVSCM